jgi:hypothetical protein
MSRFPLLALGLALAASLGTPGPADPTEPIPAELWVAALDGGRTLEEAWAAGASVRDLLPEALILADPGSAQALRDAGFGVSGPFPVPAGHTVTLIRSREIEPPAGSLDPAKVAAIPGTLLLWTDGIAAVVASDGALPPHDAVRDLGKKLLEREPVARPRPVPVETGTPLGRTTFFSPVVASIVAQVDSAAYFPWIRRLAGDEAIPVGEDNVTLATRYTMASQCETAEQYVYERFVAMGYEDVVYDPFPVQSTTARNVIATLPGVETPERIHILCGHLDSTSPTPYTSAPGANDNASGTAAVLTAAEILRNYTFRSTIRFIAFTGEEQGLVGSAHYAAAADAADEQILGVVNCDMISFWNVNRRVLLQTEAWAGSLLDVLNDACTTYTDLDTEVSWFTWGSDHVSFLQRGFPAVMAIQANHVQYPCYHKTCDTAAINLGGFGAEITAACVATICHLAGVQGATSAPTADGAAAGISLAAHPNPFDGATMLRFVLDQPAGVELTAHDVTGRRLRTIAHARYAAGHHELEWDGAGGAGRALPAGVYFLRLRAGERSVAERVVRLP